MGDHGKFPNPACICRNLTCIPENSASTVCVCHMNTDDLVQTDIYKLVLRAKGRLLWQGSFRPSENGKAWLVGCSTTGRWGTH